MVPNAVCRAFHSQRSKPAGVVEAQDGSENCSRQAWAGMRRMPASGRGRPALGRKDGQGGQRTVTDMADVQLGEHATRAVDGSGGRWLGGTADRRASRRCSASLDAPNVYAGAIALAPSRHDYDLQPPAPLRRAVAITAIRIATVNSTLRVATCHIHSPPRLPRTSPVPATRPASPTTSLQHRAPARHSPNARPQLSLQLPRHAHTHSSQPALRHRVAASSLWPPRPSSW
jgi:hypothetical protein